MLNQPSPYSWLQAKILAGDFDYRGSMGAGKPERASLKPGIRSMIDWLHAEFGAAPAR